MEFAQAVEESIAVVQFGGPALALLSVLIFELPRYLMSTLATTQVYRGLKCDESATQLIEFLDTK